MIKNNREVSMKNEKKITRPHWLLFVMNMLIEGQTSYS